MTKLIRSICLAAVLAAGTASAQQATPDTSGNPHSTKAKDKPGSDTPAAVTNEEANQAEKGNPHSTESNSARPSGKASNDSIDATERGNPDSTENKDREKLGARGNGPDRMGEMDHDGMDGDEMMKDATPSTILQRLHLSNLHEIEMGKLAEQNGTERVKSYGKMLQHEHQEADGKVTALAKKEGVTLTDTLKNPQMQKHMEVMKERFTSLKGAEFDSAFATRMSGEHRRVIEMVQGWRQTCTDRDVCSLIDTLLPTLKQHAQMGDRLKPPAAQGRAPESR